MCRKIIYKGSNTRIDKCMVPLIKFLDEEGWNTVACCCGHGKYPITVVVEDMDGCCELFTKIEIPRRRKFYKRDKQGYYYIPEVIKK